MKYRFVARCQRLGYEPGFNDRKRFMCVYACVYVGPRRAESCVNNFQWLHSDISAESAKLRVHAKINQTILKGRKHTAKFWHNKLNKNMSGNIYYKLLFAMIKKKKYRFISNLAKRTIYWHRHLYVIIKKSILYIYICVCALFLFIYIYSLRYDMKFAIFSSFFEFRLKLTMYSTSQPLSLLLLCRAAAKLCINEQRGARWLLRDWWRDTPCCDAKSCLMISMIGPRRGIYSRLQFA